MSNNTSTANTAANTNTSATNNKSQGTIVLSKSDKVARAKQVKKLFDKINKGQKVTLNDKLELASYLLETKRKLKNEFYTFITKDVMSRKQVGRHIKLILTLKSIDNYTQGMSTKNKKADEIEKNLALLVEDTRVTSLSVEQIDKMPEPTMARIIRAKLAETDELFIKAIEMDKDTLKEIREKQSKASSDKKDLEDKANKEELSKLKPTHMKTETYESLLTQDKSTLISMLQAQIDDSNTLLEELSDLKGIPKNPKPYDVDKAISHIKANTEEG